MTAIALYEDNDGRAAVQKRAQKSGDASPKLANANILRQRLLFLFRDGRGGVSR